MKIIKIIGEEGLEKLIEEPARIIKSGGLVVFPTETVYGLGADALNDDAVKKIFLAKGRPSDNPLIVHVSSLDEVERIAKPNRIARKLMDEFFPGPLTLVMEKREVVPPTTTGGLDTVAVRMPANKIALKLIEMSETPIAAPSANKSGKPSPTRAEHVLEDFRDEVDCIIDGGRTEFGLESTVVDTTTYPIEILRPGAVTKEQLEEFFEVRVVKGGETARSPGMKYRHYSPDAEVIVLVGENVHEEILSLAERLKGSGKKVGIIWRRHERVEGFEIYYAGKSLKEYAKSLFDALRQLDKKCDVIVVEGVEEEGLGVAIMNRLSKAGRVYRV